MLRVCKTDLHVLQTCKTVVIKKKPIFGLSGKHPSEHVPLPDSCPVSVSRFGKSGTKHVCGVCFSSGSFTALHTCCVAKSLNLVCRGSCAWVCVLIQRLQESLCCSLATCSKKRSVFTQRCKLLGRPETGSRMWPPTQVRVAVKAAGSIKGWIHRESVAQSKNKGPSGWTNAPPLLQWLGRKTLAHPPRGRLVESSALATLDS